MISGLTFAIAFSDLLLDGTSVEKAMAGHTIIKAKIKDIGRLMFLRPNAKA